MESAGARIPRGQSRQGRQRSTARAKTDDFAKNMYFREYDYEVLSVVEQVAKERGVTPSQIACAWILQAPGVTAPIIGATKLAHLKEAIEAVEIKLRRTRLRRSKSRTGRIRFSGTSSRSRRGWSGRVDR